MDRRHYLGTIGTLGTAGMAGCLDSVPFVGGDTALGEPEQPRGDPIHSIHGEEFPEFELPDPHADTTVTSEDLRGTPFVMTFIYTSCVEQCGTLMQLLRMIQVDAAEQGYADNINLLAITFDPDTDTPDVLREYGEAFDMDFDAGNFRFLRPETADGAIEVVNEHFGVPAEMHDDHDHDHGDDEGEERGPGVHYYMFFLVNGEGITERSYPNVVGGREDTRPNAILENVRTVAN